MKIRLLAVAAAILHGSILLAQGGWTDSGSVVRLTSSGDRVGVGTSKPSSTTKLESVQSSSGSGARAIFGRATATSGRTRGIHGSSASPDGSGIFGQATATTGAAIGVEGQSRALSGDGVFGWARSSTGVNNGVRGLADSSEGFGVFGEAVSETGITAGAGGFCHSDSGDGVFGWASSTSGLTNGVRGESDSMDGNGVFGLATSTTGAAYGVNGLSASVSGVGTAGWATAETGATIGVYGLVSSPGGVGVLAGNEAGGDLLAAANTTEVVFVVRNNGDVNLEGTVGGSADFAELLPLESPGEGCEAGDVLSLNEEGKLRRSRGPYDRTVVGVHSRKPGYLGDYLKLDAAAGEGAAAFEGRRLREGARAPVALMGVVDVKVCDEAGAIRPGDLLTTSSAPGHAMKCSDALRGAGAILGKALGRHEKGRGTVRMLLLQR